MDRPIDERALARSERPSMHQLTSHRTAAAALVEQLQINGVEHVFCVLGESFLAVLDALRDSSITVTVCRHEGAAAMMAEAIGKTTGRPGICFVTRGPGATNASAGIHIAQQDSTPMIMFVGQVESSVREREAPTASPNSSRARFIPRAAAGPDRWWWRCQRTC